MKISKILLFTLIPMAIFVGCQKELSVENGAPVAGTLQKGINGDCLPGSVNGVFIADTVLTVNNFIEVEIDITATGVYSIKSDTLNGYSFSDAGTFGVTGVQKVKLKASGTPVSPGINSFTISFGSSSSCTIDVIVLPSGTAAATFSLGGTPGACSGAIVNDTFTSGTPLTASNSITFNVMVTSAGTYTLNTNTVNGISFSQSGFFSTPGPQTVTLTGTGTPVAAGVNNYTVTAAASSCTFSIDVQSGAGTNPATFTLGGAPNACTGFLSAGVYMAGAPLSAGNTVSLEVNVTVPGTYTISTNTVNGISFSKSGTFAAIGNAQTIVLNGTGTPVATGTFNFTATSGTNSCTFSIIVIANTAPVNNDYFPLTAGSFWTYETDNPLITDSLYIFNSSSATINGNSYRYFAFGAGPVGSSSDDSIAYRKAGNDYFEYHITDLYATFTFETPVEADINFLKENAPAGTTWETPEFSGMIDPGTGTTVPAKVKYSYTITNANTSIIINGVTFNNVIHVSWKSKENINNAGYVDAISYNSYYAKGIGLIKLTGISTAFPIPVTNQIRYYQIF